MSLQNKLRRAARIYNRERARTLVNERPQHSRLGLTEQELSREERAKVENATQRLYASVKLCFHGHFWEFCDKCRKEPLSHNEVAAQVVARLRASQRP